MRIGIVTVPVGGERAGHDLAGNRDVHGDHAAAVGAGAGDGRDRRLVDQLGRVVLGLLLVGVEEGGAFAQRHRRAIGAQLALQDLAFGRASACCPPLADPRTPVLSPDWQPAAASIKPKSPKRARKRPLFKRNPI